MGDLANVLEEHSEEILQKWIARVRQHLAPGGETSVELEDHMPQFLRQLQAVLRGQSSGDQVSPEEGTSTAGREHGAQRFRLGFELGALVREYGVLRDLLLELIRQHGLHVSLEEIRLLTDFVATAIAEAVDEHAQQQARARREDHAARNARLSELLGTTQRSEAWLSTVLRSIGEAVIVTDVEGRAVFLNPVAEALTGWSGPEARGQPLARVFPLLDEASLTGMESPLRSVLRDGQTRKRAGTVLLVRKDGTRVPITDSMAALQDAAEEVFGVVLVFQDVSKDQRQKAERERLLQETERLRLQAEGARVRLDALFSQAPVAITVLRGPRFVVDLANPPLLRVWGRTSEQVLGRPVLEAVPELRDQGFEALLHGVLTTGVPFVATQMEIRFARGEGGALETGYFDFVYAPLRDERGEAGAVLAIATEVTEAVLARQKMEELLRRSREAEQARNAVLEALSAQTLISVCYQRGPALVYETANPLFRLMAGREVVGLSLREAFPELMEHQGSSGSLMRVFETGAPYVTRELRVPIAQWLGGPVREGLFDFTYQPVKAPGGGVEGVLTLVVEVTEQVRLRRAAERLAEEERERRDLEQHLIGIVSHDLRNPLSAILLGIQLLLRREGLEARTRPPLLRIQSSAERAVRMVRDLLDFTQARLGGGLKIQRTPTDLHALVRGAVEEHQMTHPERELRLVQRGAGWGAWDADRITQMMGNLLGNALKYSPAGSPVTVRSLAGPEGFQLEVHNGGAPIPPEARERLFQPLQRAVQGVDTAGRSVGLGLYIVAQIVRAHGGDVQVHSTEGQGTTFRVQLPRAPVAPETKGIS